VAPWRLLLAQLTHFVAGMLWVAALLALLARLPPLAGAIVLLNGVLAFAQEYRADRAAERLGSMMPARTRVRRGGETVRSETRPAWRIDPRRNPLVVLAVAVEAVLLVLFLGVPWLADLLGGTWPSTAGWSFCLLAAAAIPGVDAVHKLWVRRGRRLQPAQDTR
jgi:Cation transporting ATPase, C-terminus